MDRINKINGIMGRGSLILVSFLALAGAGCVYTDDSPDTNNVNEAEWGCLELLDQMIAEIKDEARDMPILALTPCTNSTGAAFMGFDFDSKIDWNSRRKVKGNIGMGDKKSNAKGVSPHLIVRLPGKGGMAEVYEVENAWPGRESAIL